MNKTNRNKIFNLIIENLRRIRDLEEKRERANARRERNEWELNSKCPIQGLEAHAVFEYLVQYEGADPETMDVYDISPEFEHYYMSGFEIISDNEFEGQIYVCGDDRDTSRTATEGLKELLDDTGYEHLPNSLLVGNIDRKYVERVAREIYEDSVYHSPEDYLNEKYRKISNEQEEMIKVMRLKIEKLENNISYLEEINKSKPNDGIKIKIESMVNAIDNLNVDIEEILESPEGDFPVELIEEYIDDIVERYSEDPAEFIYELGLNILDFIDKDGVVDEIIEHDGYEAGISTYDGELTEIYVSNTTFYVGRMD